MDETLDSNTPESTSEVAQAEATASEATQNTESESATDPAEEAARREQEKAKARENAAFAALRQREREAREEAARERAERQALMQRLMSGQTQGANDAPSGAPDPNKYAGGEFNPEFIRDMARHEARQAYKAEREAAEKQQRENAQKQAQAAAQKTWVDSVSAAQKKYADFEVIVEAASSEIPQQARMLMAGLKDGAELLYHASKNPDLAQGLSGNPVEIAAALGELRATMRFEAAKAAEQAKQEEKPIKPGNAGGRSNQEPDVNTNLEGWIKWRNKQAGRR